MEALKQRIISLRSRAIRSTQPEELSQAQIEAKKESFRGTKWFIQMTVAMAVFTDIFLYSMIVPVMPFALDTRIGVPESTSTLWKMVGLRSQSTNEPSVQNVVSILIAVYGGALALASPICGWASDQSPNRKMPLLAGLIALTGATMLLHLGPNVGILVLARILQGVSAAVVWVVGLALLSDSVPKEDLGSAMGVVFVAMSMGALIGPLFGGFVFARAGYNAVFAMAYATLAIDFVLRFMMIERKELEPPVVREIEIISATTITAMISTDDPEVPEANEKSEKEKVENVRAASVGSSSGSKSFNGFLMRNKVSSADSQDRPPILILLSSWRTISCLWLISNVAILASQFDSILPIHVKTTFNWDSTAAGLIFLPILLTSFLSPIFGYGVDRWGPRWFAVAGFLLLIPFQVLLRLVQENTIRDKVLLCVFLALIGIALDLTTPTLLVEITAIVEDKERRHPGIFGTKGAMAQAYGLFNFAWALGSLIGPIWSGFVIQRTSWATTTWTLALLSFVSAFPCAMFTGGYLFDPQKRDKARKPRVKAAAAAPEGDVA